LFYRAPNQACLGEERWKTKITHARSA